MVTPGKVELGLVSTSLTLGQPARTDQAGFLEDSTHQAALKMLLHPTRPSLKLTLFPAECT